MIDECLEDIQGMTTARALGRRRMRLIASAVILSKMHGKSDEEAARLARSQFGSVELYLLYLLIKAGIALVLWWWNRHAHVPNQ